MKKILAAIMVGVLAIGVVGCDVEIGSRKRNGGNRSGESINESISISDTKKVNIELGASEAKIYYYEGDNIEVTGVLGSFTEEVIVENRGTESYVTEKSSSRNLNFNDNDVSKLEIKIPKKYEGNMRLSLGVGKCNVDNISVSDWKIESGVGTLVVNNCTFDKLDLDCGVGNVDIKTSGKTGDIDIDGGVGNVTLILEEVGGDLEYDGGMGNTTIKIPENSPVRIDSESGLGKSKITARTSNEGTYKFDLNMGVGNLEVTN